MTSLAGIFIAGIALVSGMVSGFGVALVRPGLLKRAEKLLGLSNGRQQWFYNQNVAFHRRVDACVPDRAVLFIGDSTIQGLCVTEVAPCGINYGIGGDTTEGVLARLPEYKSLSRAAAVVLAIGDNDLRRGCIEAGVAANYRKILTQVPERIPMFLCSLTPYMKDSECSRMNCALVSLNRILQRLCSSRPACHFVDLNTALSDSEGFLLPEFADDDNAHLNGSGYRLCIEKLRKHLQEAIPDLDLKSSS